MICLVTVTPPAIEPITVAEAKLQSRITIDDEDTLIASYIQASREHCEVCTRRQFITAEYDLFFDQFPNALDRVNPFVWYKPDPFRILLPRPRLQTVESVKYLDTSGVLQTLDPATYIVDNTCEPGRIVPAYLQNWPITQCNIKTVQIRFKTGYGDTVATVPPTARQAIRLLTADFFANREPTQSVLKTVDRLLAGIKFVEF